MNVAVFIESFAYSGQAPSPINVAFSCQCTTGEYIVGQIPLDFAASATQMRSNILAGAKNTVVEAGIPGAAAATYRLFGGPV